MQRRIFHLNDLNNDVVTFANFDNESSNTRQVKQMKRILKKAIKYELTPKQRLCLCEYYLGGKSMKKIAAEQGLNPSTVTRHIQNAVSRLQRVAKYY